MNVPLVQGTGLTRRKLKRPNTKGTKFSSEKGGNRGRAARIVSYCPFDLNSGGVSLADPEKMVHVTVARRTRVGKCKNGHSWIIGGASYAGESIWTGGNSEEEKTAEGLSN